MIVLECVSQASLVRVASDPTALPFAAPNQSLCGRVDETELVQLNLAHMGLSPHENETCLFQDMSGCNPAHSSC